jgi:ParB family transcriptional regulator, chromosome partitioning protein
MHNMVLKEVDYKELVENDYNPRKIFNDAEMVSLKESIESVGLLEPLVVRKKNGKYEVVCGIRRYKALGEIGNGMKVPVNIVDVDDHQALVLSFTENFERSDFTKMEEARFFATMLKKEPTEDYVVPSNAAQYVKDLADELKRFLPKVTPSLISRRISLLALPDEVQAMIENDDDEMMLGVAELITRLRSIPDVKIRHKHMLRFATEYQGKEPNMQKLKLEIESLKETYAKRKEQHDKEIDAYQKAAEDKKKKLEETLVDVVSWYDGQFNCNLKADIEDVDEIIQVLQDKKTELTTDKKFNSLTEKQIKLEDERDKLQMNLKIVQKNHLNVCPFCGGLTRARSIKNKLSRYDEDILSLSEEKRSLSKQASEVELKREQLRKANLSYQNALDTYNKLTEGEDKDD